MYAAVEVKSTLDYKSFQNALKSNAALRLFKSEKCYVRYDPVEQERSPGKYIVRSNNLPIALAPRSYIVAFETDCTYDGLKKRFQTISRNQRSHLHGVLVLNHDWFCWQRPLVDEPEVLGHASNGTRAFLLSLIRNIDSFPMLPAQLDKYLGPDPDV